MTQDSIPCDIVLLPNPELAEKAFKVSEQLKEFGTLYTLKEGQCFPHASLYMTQLKIEDIEKVKELLADIAAATPKIDLTSTRYDQAEGYIDADYQRTELIQKLQMAVVEAINPIRDGMREKDKQRMLTITGQACENLEKYGYRGVGELFRPHISFTRFADGKPIDTSVLPDPNEFSGEFTKLGLFEMGDNGTCVRKIAEFELGDSQL